MIQTVAENELSVNEKLKIRKNTYQNGKGKRISIVTGTHGDELEGQFAVWLVGDYIKKNIGCLNGTVDIYPALNPLGIDSITRGIPGFDLDMNRVFPGFSEGTMAECVCNAIVEDIKGSEVCVDIHASNIYLRELPQIRISRDTAESLVPLAKMMNIDFVWVHESATVLRSTLAHSLNSIGTKTLVVELGVGMRINKDLGYQLLNGIINLLYELGMWSEKPDFEVRQPIVSFDGAVGFVNSDASGVFVSDVEFGSEVEKGDVIGRVLNPLTAESEPVKAVCSGLLFTLREYPVVYGGSLIARILSREEEN